VITGLHQKPLGWGWQVARYGEIRGLTACSRPIRRVARYALLAIYDDFMDFLESIRHK
jgi:hypothetical protein